MRTGRLLAIVCCVTLLCTGPLHIIGSAQAGATKLYYYSAENCPHCQEYGPLVHELAAQFGDDVELIEKDIWRDRKSLVEMQQVLATYGAYPLATPTIFLGDRLWIGLDHEKLRDIAIALEDCVSKGCPDVMSRLAKKAEVKAVDDQDALIALPVIGDWNAQQGSLPLVTLILALLDSVNPCAFFVLLFLLSLMIHAHSRARMLTVGVVFVSCSGLIYFLFMAAWLNLFLVTGGVRLVTLLAGLVAILFGVLNIKDYFLRHKGPSLAIPDQVKPGLYHRVRSLVKSPGYLPLLGSTALLAVAANSYELLCTAGLPMVFTRILTLHKLPQWQYYSYLAFYNLIYVVPLLIIVIIFAVTLGAHHLSEKQGRFLKLASGVMMTNMGLGLAFFPSLLQSLTGTIAVFAATIVLAGGGIFLSRHLDRKDQA